MKEPLNFMQKFGYNLVKKLFLPADKLDIGGIWGCEHHRKIFDSNGIKIGTKLINSFIFPNGICNVGKNYLLNSGFVSGTQILTASWCMSLIDNNGFSALAATDTMSSHGGWVEFTGYSQPNRVAWGPAVSTAQLLTNPTLCIFDISVSGNVFGAFIVSDSVIGGSNGILWTTGGFPSPVGVTAGVDELRLTYNLAC